MIYPFILQPYSLYMDPQYLQSCYINIYSISYFLLYYSMKALILVGGLGTRLRPLTLSYPKSVIPFANKPIVEYQIQALAKVGVKEIILAINYKPQIISSYLGQFQSKVPLYEQYDVKIILSKQDKPLGTAGPLKLGQKYLQNEDNLFFVFNSDVICDFNLQYLLQEHRKHNKQGTIYLKQVQQPSRYGVVVTNQKNQITSFVQKPSQFISNKINAGIYLLTTPVLKRIPLNQFSMIQKDVFPKMAYHLESILYQKSFWHDIGQPLDFLKGQESYLKFLSQKDTEPNKHQFKSYGHLKQHQTSKIGEGVELGPNVVIGPNCQIQSAVRIKNSCIMQGCVIGKGSYISGSIIGCRCWVQEWVRVQQLSVLGQQVCLKRQIMLNGVMVLPQKGVNESVKQKGKVIL